MLNAVSSRAARAAWAPQAALIVVTMIWGGTFLVVQHALTVSPPMFFVGCRFAAAALALSVVSFAALKGMTWRDLAAGSLIGVVITWGYGTQTIGLETITSSESAFLTALYVPMVPLLQWVVFRHSPRLMTWLGILCAFTGLLLLTGGGFSGLHLERGQVLTLVCALAFACEIILIGRFAGHVDVRRVTVVQLAVASLCAFCVMPLAGETRLPPFSWTLAGLAVAMGLASALIQAAMNWAQRFVSPARATIIYAGEPVWAGLLGRVVGERLPALALLGGALVVLGVIVSELKWRPFAKRRPVAPAKT